MTVELDEPGAYGRIVRDDAGDIERIVETKDPAGVPADVLAIHEVNTGTYAFAAEPLVECLDRLENDNSAGEYYLGDVLPMLREQGLRVVAHKATDHNVNLGVNNRADLALVTAEARHHILERHMLAGVTIVDPDSTWIDADVEIGPDATIEPATSLRGATTVAADAIIGLHSTVIDSRVGVAARVLHSYLVEAGRRRRGEGRPVRLPAPEGGARAGGEGRHLRRDQELAHRRGRQGPSPRLRRRRRDRGRRQRRGGRHHRELRRTEQAPDEDRGRCADLRQHLPRCPRHRRRSRLPLAPVQ